MKNHLILASIVLLSFSGLTGCKKDPKVTPTTVSKGVVQLNIKPTFDGAALQLGKDDYVNFAGNVMAVDEFKFLIGNISFRKSDGNWVNSNLYYWYDASEPSQRSFVLDSLPIGTYTAMAVNYGVDSLNDDGRDASTFPISSALHVANSGDMYWASWKEFIHWKLEGKYKDAAGVTKPYVYHLATNKNQFRKVLDFQTAMELGSTKRVVTLNADVAELFKNPVPFDINVDGANTPHMGDGGAMAAKLTANAKAGFLSATIAQ